MTALAVKFFSKIAMGPNECWQWTDAPNVKGYATLKVEGVNKRAHRLAYELLVGPIPEGLVIDHLCRNRLCVNPRHLEAVTSRENTLRGDGRAAIQARQTHCVHGHPLDGENLFRDQRGRRCCRACGTRIKRESARRRRAAQQTGGAP